MHGSPHSDKKKTVESPRRVPAVPIHPCLFTGEKGKNSLTKLSSVFPKKKNYQRAVVEETVQRMVCVGLL